jgi:hypothetical protein
MGVEDAQGEDELPEEDDAPASQETPAELSAAAALGLRIAEDMASVLRGSAAFDLAVKATESFYSQMAGPAAAAAQLIDARSTAATSALEAMAAREIDQSGVLASVQIIQKNLVDTLGGTFSAGSALAASLRMVDQLTPLNNMVSQYVLTSRALEQTVGYGTLTSWRSALEANGRIEAHLRELAIPSPVFTELAALSRVQVDLTDWAVLRSPNNGLLSATSGLPVATWRNVVAEYVDDADQLPVVVSTGRTNLALLGSDLLTSPDADPGVVAEGANRVESDIVEPWAAARQQLTRDLYAMLAELDPRLPGLLNGAWDDIVRDGPAAVEKAATCAVEVIDRALRIAAPDDAVRTWHSQKSRPASEWEGRESAPQRLRVKYLCRELGGSRDLVVSQVEALGTVVKRLRGRLEAAKHASQGDLVAVRALVCQTESVLITLFVGTSFPTN